MSSDHSNIHVPQSLVNINSLKKTSISWEAMRGTGLPDHSGNEWNLIVSFFENGHGNRNDQIEIVRFFCGIDAEKQKSTFTRRLKLELDRKRTAGKISEAAGRINKQRKLSAESAISGATSTAPAAAADESSRPPAGAARPRLLALARRRGARRPPDGFCATVGRRRRRLSRRPAALPPS